MLVSATASAGEDEDLVGTAIGAKAAAEARNETARKDFILIMRNVSMEYESLGQWMLTYATELW